MQEFLVAFPVLVTQIKIKVEEYSVISLLYFIGRIPRVTCNTQVRINKEQLVAAIFKFSEMFH